MPPGSTQVRRFTVPGGLSLEADVGGDARNPAVILMHGGGQTRHSWHNAMLELIARGHHVINLDARGHGHSDWAADGDYSGAAMVSDLRAVAATLRAPPALVGASMGGATALLAVGACEPMAARALVLVDVVPQIERAGADKILEFMRANRGGFATLDEAADAVTAYYPHRPRPRDYSGLMKNLRRRADGRLYWHWDPRFVDGVRRIEPPQYADQLSEAARRVRVPALLVRGLQSDIVSDEGVRRLREMLPALEVVDIAGAGHMVAGDKNDAFSRGVVDFLRRTVPGTQP